MNFRSKTSTNQATQFNGFQGIPAQVKKITVLQQFGIGKAGIECVCDTIA
ncbi:hypothetical protein [Pseudophaeobacter flagellatus]|nr:hypothetical protein [Pseudophaeobacter flagellatus]MCD9149281.1 hypothetical protein [Pseudophaeobacter flagellatus]